MPRRRISVTARRPSLFCVHFLRMGAGQCRKTARGEKILSLLPKTPGRPGCGRPGQAANRRPTFGSGPRPPSLGLGAAGAVCSARFLRPDCEAPASFSFRSFALFFACLVGACFVSSCLFSIPCAGRSGNRAKSAAGRGAEGKGEGKTGRARSNAASPGHARAGRARQGLIRAESQGAQAPCPQPPAESQARMALRLWHKRRGRTKAKSRPPCARRFGAKRRPGLVAAFRRAARRRRGGAGRRRGCPSAKCPNEGRRRRRADKSSGNAAH